MMQALDAAVRHRRTLDPENEVSFEIHGHAVRLWSAHGEEIFHWDGAQTLSGRGGRFDLTDITEPHLAVATVLGYLPCDEALIGVRAQLGALGYDVQAGAPLRWKYAFWLTPLRAVCRSDPRTVHWLSLCAGDTEHHCLSLHANGQWLATYINDLDHETLSMMCMSDEVLREDGLLDAVPEDTVAYGHRPSLDTLRRVLAGERGVPGTVPADFYQRGRYLAFPLEDTRLRRTSSGELVPVSASQPQASRDRP